MSDLSDAITASANRLGVSPVDLATAVSYETAGTFDPWKAGPTTKWGQHRGLIQWGEPQRAKYGVTEGMPVSGQMQAAANYLSDAGVKPGMGLMDIYSAINAGHVGRNNASDAAAGGAPGTVADKVNYQMADHRRKAEALLGGAFTPPNGGSATPAQFGDAVASPPIGPSLTAPQPVTGPDFSQLALVYLQNAADRKQQQAEQQAAEQQRRQALFGGAAAPGLFG